MFPRPQDSAAHSPEGSTLCSAAAVNYNDSGSHKKCPAPTPHALEPLPRPCVYITVLWHRRCKRVCVLVLRHPLFPFRIYPPPAPLDASWRSLLKALKSSPFALRLVCRSVSLPRFLTRSYFLRTDCKAMPWFLPVKTACFVPCP